MMETVMEEVRTTDLALATFLRLEGEVHDRFELVDGRNAIWVFLDEHGEVKASIAEYESGDVNVDLREFMRMLGEVRGELYEFLRSSAKR